jgi:hypothetical protein
LARVLAVETFSRFDLEYHAVIDDDIDLIQGNDDAFVDDLGRHFA